MSSVSGWDWSCPNVCLDSSAGAIPTPRQAPGATWSLEFGGRASGQSLPGIEMRARAAPALRRPRQRRSKATTKGRRRAYPELRRRCRYLQPSVGGLDPCSCSAGHAGPIDTEIRATDFGSNTGRIIARLQLRSWKRPFWAHEALGDREHHHQRHLDHRQDVPSSDPKARSRLCAEIDGRGARRATGTEKHDGHNHPRSNNQPIGRNAVILGDEGEAEPFWTDCLRSSCR